MSHHHERQRARCGEHHPGVRTRHDHRSLNLIQERADGIQKLTLDNADAWHPGPYGGPTSILKGPMFAKLRAKQEAKVSKELVTEAKKT